MHELSIALSIIEVAAEEAERRGVKVISVRLRLGPLSGVVGEALQSAYELAREGSPLEQARLLIEPVPILAECPTCRQPRPVRSIQDFCCAVCGTSTAAIVSGREMEVVGLEVIDIVPDDASLQTPRNPTVPEV